MTALKFLAWQLPTVGLLWAVSHWPSAAIVCVCAANLIGFLEGRLRPYIA